jgi:solute carrier family 25 (mitochondrial citrate transporter), member 1
MVAADAEGNKPSPLVALLAGGIAGGVEAACTYPFEFAKTRVQLYGHQGVRNPFAVVAKVAREEGLRALYKGCSTMIAVCCFHTESRRKKDEKGWKGGKGKGLTV